MTPPQLQYLKGHSSPIYAVATSPDGTTMLSAGLDGTIRAWDRATNEPIRVLGKDLPGIISLAVAPNGLHFAAGSVDHQVRIYDLPSNFPRATIANTPNTGGRIDVMPDGSAALTGDISRTVRLWDLATNQTIKDFAGSTQEISSVLIVSAYYQPPAPPAEKAPAKEGEEAETQDAEEEPVELPPPFLKPKYAVAAAKDGTVRIWDIESGQSAGVINTTQQNSLAASREGKVVVGAGEDGLLRSLRWPLTAPASLPGFGDQVTSVAIAADSELLLAGSLDSKVNLFKAEDGTLVHALAGQSGKTTSVAINADSSLVAGGSDLGTIKFWSVEDAAEGLILAGHTGAVNRLAFPAKGDKIASAGFDGTVRIWDPPVAPRPVPGHSAAVNVVATTADGKTALSTGADKLLRLWEVKTGEELRTIKDLPQPIVTASFSKDGKQLVLGDAAGTISIQDTKEGSDQGRLLAHQGPVTGVALSAEADKMVSSSADGTVKLWSLPVTSPQLVKEEEQPVAGLAVSSDGKFIVAGTSHGKLQMMDGASGEPLKKLEGESGPISNLTLSADNKTLAVATANGAVKLWNAADGSTLGEVAGHAGAIHGIALHPSEPKIATAGEDNTVRVWQMPVAPTPVVKNEKGINAVALSPDGTVGLVGSADGKSSLVKLADGKPVAELAASETGVVSVAFKKDNTSIATGDEAGTIQLYSPTDGSSQGIIYGHKGPVTAIDFNPVPSQPLLLSSGADGTVKLWQLPLTPDAPLPVSKSEVSAVAVSADGMLTLVASADQSVRLFNASGSQALLLEKLPEVVTDAGFTADSKQMLLALAGGHVEVRNTADGALVTTLAGQTGGIQDLAVSSKAPQAATAGSNGTIRLWQIPTEIKPLGNHTGAITAIDISPNGQLVATASADKSVRIWKLADGSEMWTLGHSNPVTAMAWKSDSSQLATADGKVVRLWNIGDGAQAATFEEHGADLAGVAFSADSNSLITAGKDKLVKVWKIAPAEDDEEAKKPLVLEGHGGAITAMASVGPTVATGDQSGSVRTWKLAEAKPGIEIKYGEPVVGLAVSADQKLIAAGGKGKVVKLYNVADGKAGPDLTGLKSPVANIAFSADNKRVAATSAEGEILVWAVTGELLDVQTLGEAQATVLDFAPDHLALLVGGSDNKIRNLPPALVKELTIGEAAVNAVAYTPDGASLVAGSKDKTVKLCTIADGKAAKSFDGSSASVTAVAVSPDGTKVIAADQGKAVRCWNLADAKLLTMLSHPTVVKNLSVSADNSKLATGADDGQVRVWQLPEGRLLQRFVTHEKEVSGLAFLPDNKTFISGGLDQKVVKTTLAATLMLAAHEGGAFDVAFLANGTQFLSAGADKLVKMFDLAGAAVRQFAGAEGAIRSFALKADNTQLAAGSDDKHVHFWTVANAAAERKVVTSAAVSSVSYNADGTRLAAAGGDGHLRVLQTTDGLIVEDQTLEATPEALAFLPDSKTILVGDEAGSASIRTLSLLRVFQGHTAPVQCVDFTPTGTFVVSGGADKNLNYWNLADGALVRTIAHPDVVTGVSVTADGSFAITSCVDKSLRQWNLGNGSVAWTMTTDQPLRSLVVSKDKTRAAVSADDKSVRVVDLAIQRELQRFMEHAAVPTRLAMTEDNKTLLSAGPDKTVRKQSIAAERVIVADAAKVNAVALLPDGSHIISAGDDHITKLWDLEGKLVRQFGGNPTAVRTMAVRPDGKQVALGGDPASAQMNLYLFNIEDGALQFTIPTPAGIHNVAYSPDGKLAVSEADNHVRVYDSTTSKLLQDFTLPALPTGLSFADDTALVTAAADNQAYVLTYALDQILSAHEGSVTGLAYLPDGEHVVTAGVDKTVKLWKLSDGTVAGTFDTAGIAINDLALSGDGKILAAASADNKVRVWNVPEKPSNAAVAVAQTLDHPTTVMSVGLNKDGSRLAVGCNDASVYIWDTKLQKLLEKLAGNTGQINSVKISSDGAMVLSGGADKTAWRWMTAVQSAAIASEGPLTSVACESDGSQIFTAGADGMIKGWLSTDLSPGAEFKGLPTGATYVAAGPEGKYLAAAGADGTVQLWEVEGAKPVATLKSSVPAVDIALGVDAQKIIVAGNDNFARSYALTEIEEKPALELVQQALGATGPITELALAEDDHTLVTVSDDRNLRRYHIASGSPLKEFEAHDGEVYSLAYNTQGTQLATGGGDHTLAVWDLTEDKLVMRCTGHTGQVQGISFEPKGQNVASAALDGTIRLWSLEANLPGDRPALPKAKPADEETLAASSPMTPARPREPGLIAEQYATDNQSGESEISIVENLDFDWKDEHPESFSVRYSGYLIAPFEGEVTFTAEADDGLRMNVGGTMVIDGPAPDGPREGKLMMVAGESVPFRLDYVQKAEMAKLKIYWSWEGQEKQIIPAEAFQHQPVYVGDEIAKIEAGDAGGLMAVQYSADGNSLLAGGTGKKWGLWSTKDGSLVREGLGHNQTIYGLQFNAANTRIVSLDYSGKLFIWNAGDAAPLFHQQLPAWAGYSVSYFPDGTEVIAGTSDSRVIRVVIPVPAR